MQCEKVIVIGSKTRLREERERVSVSILRTSCPSIVFTVKALAREKMDSFMMSVVGCWAMKAGKTASGAGTGPSSTATMVDREAYPQLEQQRRSGKLRVIVVPKHR
jgi:hypothetical protein